MSATNAADQARIDLEHVLACLVDARHCLQVAGTRMVQRMRTKEERLDLDELARARVDLEEAWNRLIEFHPNRLKTEH